LSACIFAGWLTVSVNSRNLQRDEAAVMDLWRVTIWLNLGIRAIFRQKDLGIRAKYCKINLGIRAKYRKINLGIRNIFISFAIEK
jgi:hypothetical protein